MEIKEGKVIPVYRRVGPVLSISLFLFVLFLLILYPLTKNFPPVILIPILLVLLAYYISKETKDLNSKVKIISESIRSGEIFFQEEQTFEIGEIEIEGYYTGSGSHRSYSVKHTFKAERESRGIRAKVPFGPYYVSVDKEGEGIIRMRGLRIKEGNLKGVVICGLTPSFEYEVERGGRLTISTQEDYSEMRVFPSGNSLKGEVKSFLRRARKVRVKFCSEDAESVLGEGESFSFELNPINERILVFSQKTSPKEIAERLGLESCVCGVGEFLLELSLNLPLGRDVSSSLRVRGIPSTSSK